MGLFDVLQDIQRQDDLQLKKQEKINSLSKKKDTILGKPEQVDYTSAEDLQYRLGYELGNQVYTRDDGSKYQYKFNPDGTYAHDAQGNWIEEDFVPEGRFGTRNLYIDDTRNDMMKLGLARGDLSDEALAAGYTPYTARYADKTNLPFKMYKGRGGEYDGTPGPLGVTPEDGALMDVEMPYQQATELEYDIHRNAGQMANRAIGQGEVSDMDAALYGGGKTEYTTEDAPLWNIDAKVDGVELEGDTPLPSVPYGMAAPKKAGEKDPFDEILKDDELSQTISAVAASAGKGAVELADAIQELVTWAPQAAYNKITGENIDIDLIDKEFKEEAIEAIDKFAGYDRKSDEEVLAAAMEEVKSTGLDITSVDSIKEVLGDSEKMAKLGNATLKVLMDPSLTASFMAEIVGAGGVLGAGTKLAGKIGAKVAPKLTEKAGDLVTSNRTRIGKEVNKVKADAGLSAAEKSKRIAILEKDYTLGKKVADFIKGTAMTNADMAIRVNNDLDAYKENNGGISADPMKTLQIIGLNRLASNAEIGALKIEAGMTKAAKEAVKGGILKAAGEAIKHTAKSVGVEATQETFDGIVEQINQKLDSKKYEGKTVKDILSETSAEVVTGMIAGGASGAHLGGIGAVGKVASTTKLPSAEKIKAEMDRRKATKKEDTEEKDLSAEDVKTALNDVANKLDSGEGITSADISTLDKVARYMDKSKTATVESKKVVENIVQQAKDEYKKQLDTDKAPVLKSKSDLLFVMADVMPEKGTEDVELDKKLYTLASKAGIVQNEEEYHKIKKDFYSVEKEATTGRHGYITMGSELKGLLDTENVDVKKVKAKVSKLRKFKTSQETYLNKAEEIIKKAQVQAATYNSSLDSKLPMNKPKALKERVNKVGDTLTIKFTTLDDGTIEANVKDIEGILDAKRRNISGINQVLSDEKERLSEYVDLGTEVVVSTTGVAKGVQKALEAVEKRIAKHNVNKIITVPEASRNDYTKKLVEVNDENTNLNEYEADDNVLVSIPTGMKASDVKKMLGKSGAMYKVLKAATDAGATIHIDAGKLGDAGRKAVVDALVGYGTKYQSETVGSDIFMPEAKMKKVREDKKAEAERKEKVKAVVEATEKKAIKEYLDGKSVDDIYKNDEILQKQYKDIGKLKRRLEGQVEKQVGELVKDKLGIKRREERVKILKKRKPSEEKLVAINAELDAIEETKSEVKEKESKVHKKVKEAVDSVLAERKRIAGVLDKIQDIKDQELDKDAEETAIQELIYETVGDVRLEVLEQPKVSRTYTQDENKIPLELKKYVKVNNADSILQVIPVDMMFDEIGIGKTSVEYVEDIETFLKKSQKIAKEEEKLGKSKIDRRDVELHDSPALGLVLDADENIDPQVAMAMKLALGEYVAFNMNMLDGEYKSKADVAQMIGVLEGQVGPETYDLLRDKGVFNKTAATKVGSAVMSKLGLGFKKGDGVEKELYDKLVADIGNMALLYGREAKIVEETRVSTKDYNAARESDTKTKVPTTESDAEIVMLRTPKRVENRQTEEVMELVEDYKMVHEHLDEDTTFEKRPSRRPIKVSESRHKREQVAKDVVGTQIPKGKEGQKSPVKFMEELVKMEWSVDKKALKRLMELDEDVMKKYLGYKAEDGLDSMTYEGRDSALAKNREIEKSIEEMQKLQEDVKKVDKAGDVYRLYFDWFYSGNGRYMMDSNTINPQNDKLHRFIVQPKEHLSEYTVKDGKVYEGRKDVTEEMNYAIAQAFGYAVDKKSTDSINAVADEIKAMGYSKLRKMVYAGEHMETPNGVELEVEHLSHTLQALDVLKEMKEGNTFESSITAEYDAVTSGFGLKLMQMPILKDIWRWLNKVGVFQKGRDTKDSMNDVLAESGFYDSYQELAKGVKVDEDTLAGENNQVKQIWGKLIDVLPQSVGDEVSKELRTLFKDPFMTFNYAAGIRSIKASLANKLSNDVLAGIVKNDEKYKSISKILATQTGVSVNELIQALKDKPAESVKLNKGIKVGKKVKYDVKALLDAMMEESYGNAVENIMKTEFEEYMKVNDTVNGSFRVMFDAFKVEYDKKKAEYKVGEWTEDAFNEVMAELKEQFPIIKGPLSEGIEDGIGIYDMSQQTITDENMRYAPAQTKTGKNKEGERTLKVRHAIKDFEAAISAGAVVPIHYIDGALMAQMSGVTAIHDAVMPKLSESKDTVKKYNQAMYEVNKGYSLVGAIKEMLDRVNVTDAKHETEIKIWVDGKSKLTKMSLKDAYKQLKEDVTVLDTRIEKAKAEVYPEVATIGHMAGMPGSMYSLDTETAVEAAKNQPKSEAKADTEQAGTKEKDSKIANIEYVQARIVPWMDTTELVDEINQAQDTKTLDVIIEAINCKGNS